MGRGAGVRRSIKATESHKTGRTSVRGARQRCYSCLGHHDDGKSKRMLSISATHEVFSISPVLSLGDKKCNAGPRNDIWRYLKFNQSVMRAHRLISHTPTPTTMPVPSGLG